LLFERIQWKGCGFGPGFYQHLAVFVLAAILSELHTIFIVSRQRTPCSNGILFNKLNHLDISCLIESTGSSQEYRCPSCRLLRIKSRRTSSRYAQAKPSRGVTSAVTAIYQMANLNFYRGLKSLLKLGSRPVLSPPFTSMSHPKDRETALLHH
jgi:hypothetical protein